MVQEFNVVRCFSCSIFQVEQVKKSTNKWTCKVCHEKQSLKQVFFKGSGKECRHQVQHYNMKQQQKQMKQDEVLLSTSEDDWIISNIPGKEKMSIHSSYEPMNKKSKWSTFIEEKESRSLEERKSAEEPVFRDTCIGIKKKGTSKKISATKTTSTTGVSQFEQRRKSRDSSRHGKFKTSCFDAEEEVSNDNTQDILEQQGDTVYAKSLPQKDREIYATNLFTSQRNKDSLLSFTNDYDIVSSREYKYSDRSKGNTTKDANFSTNIDRICESYDNRNNNMIHIATTNSNKASDIIFNSTNDDIYRNYIKNNVTQRVTINTKTAQAQENSEKTTTTQNGLMQTTSKSRWQIFLTEPTLKSSDSEG